MHVTATTTTTTSSGSSFGGLSSFLSSSSSSKFKSHYIHFNRSTKSYSCIQPIETRQYIHPACFERITHINEIVRHAKISNPVSAMIGLICCASATTFSPIFIVFDTSMILYFILACLAGCAYFGVKLGCGNKFPHSEVEAIIAREINPYIEPYGCQMRMSDTSIEILYPKEPHQVTTKSTTVSGPSPTQMMGNPMHYQAVPPQAVAAGPHNPVYQPGMASPAGMGVPGAPVYTPTSAPVYSPTM